MHWGEEYHTTPSEEQKELAKYLADLGVDVIWFSPLYPSPNADYGYDIADYMDINPEYGDMDTFKILAEDVAGEVEISPRILRTIPASSSRSTAE